MSLASLHHSPGFKRCSTDGGPATSARLNTPTAVAVDGKGNVYIVDSENYRVRKVNARGIITTVAGNGKFQCAPTGDGGPATAATIRPAGIALDRAGNLSISERESRIVRRVNAKTGKIETVAGQFGYCNRNTHDTGDGGPAGKAYLHGPWGITVDAQGNLYIATYYRVRKVTNRPPVASFAARPPRGKAPLVVTFDARASRDPDGVVFSYAWSFGDGANGGGSRARHTFSRPGSFQVRLTVTDDSGATTTVTRTIRVAP